MASQSRLDEPAAAPAQRPTGPIAKMFDRRRLLTQLLLLANRAAITAAKFFLAVYTARYLGLADLGIYGAPRKIDSSADRGPSWSERLRIEAGTNPNHSKAISW